jgi:hypothetical protein
VLPAQPTGPMSCLLEGNCPGGKPVWRNICHHGVRGHYHDRGISSLLIDDSNVYLFRFLSRLLANIVTSQITPTDHVSISGYFYFSFPFGNKVIPLKFAFPFFKNS